MIRVLHSVSHMDRAGVETMLMNYYRHIDRTRVQFDFLCNKRKPGAYDAEIEQLGGRIYHTPGLNPLKYPEYQRYMCRLFDEHPEYRILHTHNTTFGVYPMDAAKRKGVPHRIFHGHGTAMARDLKLPLKLLCKTQVKRLMSDGWACSKAAARFYFGERFVREGRYHILHNAVDPERFAYQPQVRQAIRRQYALEDCVVIGHVGRFTSEKNHGFLLQILQQALALQPKARLVLLGDGTLMEQTKALAGTLGIADKVLFVGNVPNANEWYQAFDVFVLPSHNEGLPVVGIEAQAAGLPCLFSTAVPDEVAITHLAAFLSLSQSAREWAERALRAAATERRDQTDAIRAAGYDIAVEAKKLEALYLAMAAPEGA